MRRFFQRAAIDMSGARSRCGFVQAGSAGTKPIAVTSLPAAPASPTSGSPKAAGSAALSAEEAALVGRIDAALRAGDAATALSLAADHARKFPHGTLAPEREGARVVARCMTGDKIAARAGAEAFLNAHPRSPMRARILAACGTSSPAATNGSSAAP